MTLCTRAPAAASVVAHGPGTVSGQHTSPVHKSSSRNRKDTSVVDKGLQAIELLLEVSMLERIRNHWFRSAGMLIGAALTLSTLVLSLQPAKAQCLGVDLGLVCAGLGVPSAFSHHAYYYDYPYPGYPPATAAPAPVPQYGSTAPAGRGPEQCRNDVCGRAIRTARTTNRDAAVGPLPADLAAQIGRASCRERVYRSV